MSERVDELRDLFRRLGGEGTFVERQTERRGHVRSDEEVDAKLRALVAEMRTRYGFRTSLSDAALATLIRRYYAGDDDDAIAARLGVDAGIVAHARVNLQLFREDDLRAPFDLSAAMRRLDEGDAVEDVAAEVDVAPSTLRRYRRVVEAYRAASRTSHEFAAAVESVLSEAGFPSERPGWVRNDRYIESDEFGSETATA